MSTSDKIYGLIFSEISLGLVVPILLGVLILAFPTVIADFLATVQVSFPPWLWGGPQIPLQHIFTIGTAEGLLTAGIPIILAFYSGRWIGGQSGFLLSLLYVLGMAAYYLPIDAFFPTLDWLAIIVAGMLVGYITGSLWTKFQHSGNVDFKHMLLASLVASLVAIIITTQTYIWYSPMFQMSMEPGMTYMDAVGLAYFTYTAIYGLWAVIATFIAMLANNFARAYGVK